jgi:hypothetical protein
VVVCVADHALVEQVLTWLDSNWSSTNAPKPVLIDRDDAESASFAGRRVAYDLTDDNVISVGASPDRLTQPVGTEYDHRVEDGANLRIEAAHADEYGEVTGADEFQSIVDEARRAILTERTSQPTAGGTDYHTVLVDGGRNRAPSAKDYYRYDFDVLFVGYEDLP